MSVLSEQMALRIQQILSLRSLVAHLWSSLKRKHQQHSLWKWCVQNFALAEREIGQFGGKSSTARCQTYFYILADTALRIFIQFPARTVGTSWSALVPVKRWPIICKGVRTGKKYNAINNVVLVLKCLLLHDRLYIVFGITKYDKFDWTLTQNFSLRLSLIVIFLPAFQRHW